MSLSPPPSREKLPVTTEGGRQVAEMPRAWLKWFTDIKQLIAPAENGGQIIWSAISKLGSNLTDLTVRNHADLQNVNSSTYTHLTELNATDLTDGGNTILHKHTHNLQDGLQGGATDDYYHLTLTHHTDLTDGGNTALHKHTHNDQDGLQGGVVGQYYHLEEQEHHGLLDALGTNLVSGCTLSINADNTKFDVSSGLLYFTDSYTDPLNPVFTPVSYAGSTANSVTNLATQDSTYVSIDKNGVLYQSATKISAGDTRDKVLLGALVHTNRTSISSADSNTNVIGLDIPNCVSDLSYAMGVISEGNLYSGNATNTLRLDKSVGYFWQIGINWKNDKKNPNRITAPASTGATHLATWRNGTGGWVTAAKTDIIPNRYDDGTGGATTPSGVLATNKWQIIKIWYLPNSQLTGIEYGQVVYNSEAEAEANKGVPTTDNPALTFLPFRGWLLVRGGATNLNSSGDAVFIDAGKFGQLTSGAGTGSSTTTLQGAYNNSTQPQIVTSTTSGAVQIKRGSAADTDVVFEVLNGAGSAVFQITGQGAGSAISLAVARAVSTLRI